MIIFFRLRHGSSVGFDCVFLRLFLVMGSCLGKTSSGYVCGRLRLSCMCSTCASLWCPRYACMCCRFAILFFCGVKSSKLLASMVSSLV